MPVKEQSFRIGCGRYISGTDALKNCGEEIVRLGKNPLIIGGKTALSITKETMQDSIAKNCEKYEFITHTGTCNDHHAKKYADYAANNGYNVIVGVGGGVIMDLAKLCAFFAHLPVVNIPTSSATCAAYTPLSVRYTDEGRTIGTQHFGNEVNSVIADTAVIATQPTRLLLSGVFDAIAKFLEIKHRYNEDCSEFPLGLDYAYALSERSFDFLFDKSEKCINDSKERNLSFDLENLIFTSIAVTGVISGIARGSNQTALGHKLYETARYLFPSETKPYLHGELVGVGLLLQNFFNGEQEYNEKLLSLMKTYNMPCRISDVGIKPTDENFELLYDEMCKCSAISEIKSEAVLKKLWDGFEYLKGLE